MAVVLAGAAPAAEAAGLGGLGRRREGAAGREEAAGRDGGEEGGGGGGDSHGSGSWYWQVLEEGSRSGIDMSCSEVWLRVSNKK